MNEESAGLLIMAIAGGALVVVQRWLADIDGLQQSFLLTAERRRARYIKLSARGERRYNWIHSKR